PLPDICSLPSQYLLLSLSSSRSCSAPHRPLPSFPTRRSSDLGETSYPLLQKVLVAFGDKIAFEDTLDSALDSLFGGDSGAEAGDTNVPDNGEDVVIDEEGVPHLPGEIPDGSTSDEGNGEGTSGSPPSEEPTQQPTEEPSTTQTELEKVLHEAKDALADRDKALKEGDWSAYGKADKRLTDAITRALELEQE